MPARTADSRQRQASSAKLSGGTTKHDDMLTKGRSRHCFSPPAIMCSISIDSSKWAGSTQLDPTCFEVAATQA